MEFYRFQISLGMRFYASVCGFTAAGEQTNTFLRHLKASLQQVHNCLMKSGSKGEEKEGGRSREKLKKRKKNKEKIL